MVSVKGMEIRNSWIADPTVWVTDFKPCVTNCLNVCCPISCMSVEPCVQEEKKEACLEICDIRR